MKSNRCHITNPKLIFWIVGVVGGYAKKYPTRKAHIHRELEVLLWAKNIAQTWLYRKNYREAI